MPGLSESQRQQRLAARLGSRLVDGVLTIAASEHRQQLRNRQGAGAPGRPARCAGTAATQPAADWPTRGSQERRIEAKKQRGQLKKQRTWDRRDRSAEGCLGQKIHLLRSPTVGSRIGSSIADLGERGDDVPNRLGRAVRAAGDHLGIGLGIRVVVEQVAV